MIVFKNFLRILWRYRLSVGLYLFIFMIISLLSGSNAGKNQGFIDKKAKIVIFDHSQTEVSGHFIDYIKSYNILVTISDESQIEESLLNEVMDAALIIPEDFDSDPANNNIVIYNNIFFEDSKKVIQEVSGYMYLLLSARNNAGEINYPLLNRSLEQSAEVKMLQTAQTNQRERYWFKRYMNASAYPVISVIILAMGLLMADFNAPKIAFRNKCAGKSLKDFQLSLLAGQMIFGLLIWFLILGMGILFQKDNFLKLSIPVYALNLGVFILTILSFSYLLNNLIRDKNTLAAIANSFALGSSFISGSFVPLEFLGGFVKKIARFLPSYYFVMANESIFLQNKEWFFNLAMQLLFAVSCILLGLYFAGLKQREASLQI